MRRISQAAAQEILRFIAITGSNAQVLAALEAYRGRNQVFDQGLEELGLVVKYLASFGVPEDHFAVDLTIARGLDYYTGTVYETVMLDHPEIGSICSGGRYDNLLRKFGKNAAAIGFVIVIDDLLENHSVLINLENLDLDEAQRIIDTLIGACYAINATIKKAAQQTYLLAPSTVEIAGTYADDGKARTLEEVGKEFNVTRERIRQIEAKALRKLRHPSRSKKLRDFLN